MYNTTFSTVIRHARIVVSGLAYTHPMLVDLGIINKVRRFAVGFCRGAMKCVITLCAILCFTMSQALRGLSQLLTPPIAIPQSTVPHDAGWAPQAVQARARVHGRTQVGDVRCHVPRPQLNSGRTIGWGACWEDAL